MKRTIIPIRFDPKVKNAIDDLCRRRGMFQFAVVSRIVNWFVAQDDIVQASVLGLLSPEHIGDLSQILLERMAAGHPKKQSKNPRSPGNKQAR